MTSNEELRKWAKDGERLARFEIESHGSSDVLGVAYRACGCEIPRLLDELAAAEQRADPCHHHDREHRELIEARRELDRLREGVAGLIDRLREWEPTERGVRGLDLSSAVLQGKANAYVAVAEELDRILAPIPVEVVQHTGVGMGGAPLGAPVPSRAPGMTPAERDTIWSVAVAGLTRELAATRVALRSVVEYLGPRVMRETGGSALLCGACGRYLPSERHADDCRYAALLAEVAAALRHTGEKP